MRITRIHSELRESIKIIWIDFDFWHNFYNVFSSAPIFLGSFRYFLAKLDILSRKTSFEKWSIHQQVTIDFYQVNSQINTIRYEIGPYRKKSKK